MIPVNDDFENRIVVVGDSFSFTGDNTLATIQTGEPLTNYHSVWYEFVPTQDGNLTLTKSAGVNVALNVFLGSTIANLLSVKSGNNTVNLNVKAAQSYKIAVCGQDSSTVGSFTITGTFVNEYSFKYIGPTTPTLEFNNVGMQGIVVEQDRNRIFILRDFNLTVYYSDDGGTTWVTDRVFPGGDIYPAGQKGLFFDSNYNLIVAVPVIDGSNILHFLFAVRDKITGIWTDYTSSTLSEGNNYSRVFSVCQGEDRTIHFVRTFVKNDSITDSNIVYCKFLNGVVSTPVLITQYRVSGQSVGFISIQVISHNGKILVFYKRLSGSNNRGPTLYAEITSPPLTIDAQYAAINWVTSYAYLAGDLVTQSGVIYSCLINHTSGVFATDLGNGKWTILGNYIVPSNTGFTDTTYVNQVRSNGKIYCTLSPTNDKDFMQDGKLYEDFIDITPPEITVPGNLQIFYVELAMNGDLALYGSVNIFNTGSFVLMRKSGTWRAIHQSDGSQSYDLCAGHTYNYAVIK